MVPLIIGSILLEYIKRVKSIPAAVRESLELKLPTTSEEYDNYRVKVAHIFKSYAGINIYNFEESEIPTNHEEKPLNSLGYNLENIEKTIEEIKIVATELKKGEAFADKLEDLSKSGEAKTPIGRKALIFITNIVTKAMKLSFRNTTVVVHQLKSLGRVVSKEAQKEEHNS